MSEELPVKLNVLGLMSGTSLDGLDLALCSFEIIDETYAFKILEAETVSYTSDWKKNLKEASKLSAENYFELHASYGKHIAETVSKFLSERNLGADLIASHGHTVFHQPQRGFSTQIGCGATIAALTGINTVCDFRSIDVALGGQGAPLVPIGDEILFGRYEACLNLGGIANISFRDATGKRIAYDVCEANMLLNYIAEKIGQSYDEGGEMARSGIVNVSVLKRMNGLPYYDQKGAKSVGREWFEQEVLKRIEGEYLRVTDLAATATEHIAMIIARELHENKIKTVLATGGGAKNNFLIERIRLHSNCEIIIPEELTIDFKEALIFAFLGYLRIKEHVNTLNSVTGASRNTVGGAVYLGK